MQPDDPSITPVSTAAAAIAFSIFLVLMDHAFLLVGPNRPKLLPDYRMLSLSFNACAMIAQTAGNTFVDDRSTRQCSPRARYSSRF